MRKEKASDPKGHLSKPAKISKIKEPLVGGGEVVLHLVLWLVIVFIQNSHLFFFFKIAIFEVDASLKRMS